MLATRVSENWKLSMPVTVSVPSGEPARKSVTVNVPLDCVTR
jgi:hypothetical protein